VDFVQLQINYLDVLNGPSGRLHEIAMSHNKPIIVMEPVKGGVLAKLEPSIEAILKASNKEETPASWAIRYSCSLEGVCTTLSGMSDLAQVEDNLKTCKDFKPITPDEKAVLEQVASAVSRLESVPCTGCKYCLESCPKGIEIPRIFSLYNKVRESGSIAGSAAEHSTIPKKRRASSCIKCGACESHCPQKIKIPQELVRAAAVFE
jgi:predicted aldo/keto reductase-like oxidoreductase